MKTFNEFVNNKNEGLGGAIQGAWQGMKQGWAGQQQQGQQQQGQQQQGQQQQGQQQQGQQLNAAANNIINIMKNIPDEKLKQSLHNAFGQYMLAVKSQMLAVKSKTDYINQLLRKMR